MKLETSEFMVKHLTELIESDIIIGNPSALYYYEVRQKHEKNIISKKMLKPQIRCEYCGQKIEFNGICLNCRI